MHWRVVCGDLEVMQAIVTLLSTTGEMISLIAWLMACTTCDRSCGYCWKMGMLGLMVTYWVMLMLDMESPPPDGLGPEPAGTETTVDLWLVCVSSLECAGAGAAMVGVGFGAAAHAQVCQLTFIANFVRVQSMNLSSLVCFHSWHMVRQSFSYCTHTRCNLYVAMVPVSKVPISKDGRKWEGYAKETLWVDRHEKGKKKEAVQKEQHQNRFERRGGSADGMAKKAATRKERLAAQE